MEASYPGRGMCPLVVPISIPEVQSCLLLRVLFRPPTASLYPSRPAGSLLNMLSASVRAHDKIIHAVRVFTRT